MRRIERLINAKNAENMKPKLEFIKTNLTCDTFISPQIKKYIETKCIGKTLNLFAGKTRLKIDEYRVDLDKTCDPDSCMDAYDFIHKTKKNFSTVLLDPPYSYRKSMEYYKGNYTSRFKLIADEIGKRKIKRVISMGYHTTFMGAVRGYQLPSSSIFLRILVITLSNFLDTNCLDIPKRSPIS